MDQEKDPQVNPAETPAGDPAPAEKVSRRRALKYGVSGIACLCGGAAIYKAGQLYYTKRVVPEAARVEVFKGDAPQGEVWEEWQRRGWVREARHYLEMGENVQCHLCPNECILEPEDRSRCRGRVYKDGKLYTMSYGDPCAVHADPIEKKPLFHFMPGTRAFSIATSGCGFRCLNCQNWEISQAKPEEVKDDSIPLCPDDVVTVAKRSGCESIAYTYSEPTVWYEYMYDTAKVARANNVKNVWVTCGYIQEKPLVELCEYMDAANVDLKSFDDEIYKKLNSGKLEPILNTLKTLDREGVWFEVTNLIVPTYTDKPDMIRRMCGWLVENLGPDYPLHFSRFHPQHKLTNLPPTPVAVLEEARSIAREVGLHYVYVGNCREVEDAETTFCPKCKEAVIRRNIYSVESTNLDDGKCAGCGTKIAGVWDA